MKGKGKSCLVVLVGNHTASRPRLKYETKKAWDDARAVVGVYIHKIKNSQRLETAKGAIRVVAILRRL